MKKEIKVQNRKSTFVELKDYCVGSMGTHIYDSEGERQIHLSYGQFDAIKKCVKAIDKSHYKK